MFSGSAPTCAESTGPSDSVASGLFFTEASSGARVDVEFVAGRTASRATLHYLIWIYLVISLIIVDVNCTLDRLRFQRVCL